MLNCATAPTKCDTAILSYLSDIEILMGVKKWKLDIELALDLMDLDVFSAR